jgi:hypothetical protein
MSVTPFAFNVAALVITMKKATRLSRHADVGIECGRWIRSPPVPARGQRGRPLSCPRPLSGLPEKQYNFDRGAHRDDRHQIFRLEQQRWPNDDPGYLVPRYVHNEGVALSRLIPAVLAVL